MGSRAPDRDGDVGPVAGVTGSRYLGDLKGVRNLMSFDAGGTNSDLNPSALLDGAMSIGSAAAVSAIRDTIAALLSLTTTEGSVGSAVSGRLSWPARCGG